MSEPTEKTLQDLYDWSDRLTGNWLDLGERLRRYADAWKADVEELRAEVEGLTQERDEAEQRVRDIDAVRGEDKAREALARYERPEVIYPGDQVLQSEEAR